MNPELLGKGPGAARIERGRDRTLDAGAVVRMHERQRIGERDDVVGWDAEDRAHFRSPAAAVGGDVVVEDADAAALGREPEPLLALPQRSVALWLVRYKLGHKSCNGARSFYD